VLHGMTVVELLDEINQELQQQKHGFLCGSRVSGECTCWKERVTVMVNLLAADRAQMEALG